MTTPERRKELEERAREWLADHVMHVKVTGYDSILSLLEAVDREAEEWWREWDRGVRDQDDPVDTARYDACTRETETALADMLRRVATEAARLERERIEGECPACRDRESKLRGAERFRADVEAGKVMLLRRARKKKVGF